MSVSLKYRFGATFKWLSPAALTAWHSPKMIFHSRDQNDLPLQSDGWCCTHMEVGGIFFSFASAEPHKFAETWGSELLACSRLFSQWNDYIYHF